MSGKRIPLNQNGRTADFRMGIPFERNLHAFSKKANGYKKAADFPLQFFSVYHLFQTLDKRNQAKKNNNSYNTDNNTDNHMAPYHCKAHTNT